MCYFNLLISSCQSQLDPLVMSNFHTSQTVKFANWPVSFVKVGGKSQKNLIMSSNEVICSGLDTMRSPDVKILAF